MNILLFISTYVGVVFFAWGITAWTRQYALKRSILDLPNLRSSHSEPTPRGGGFSISIIALISVLVLWLSGYLSYQILLAIGCGGFLVSVVGWLDDKHNIAVIWRAISYLTASAWAAYWVIYQNSAFNQFNYLIFGISLVSIAWMTNLYNFMDGSDALAASQAVCTALIGGVLLMLADYTGLSLLLFILSAACFGFLIWNWPPAKIFMGDVGSCFTGFIFASVALIGSIENIISIAVWLILLSIFICDTSLTLMKRMFNGEKWYKAHRNHAYQLLIQSGMSHRQLVISLILINSLLLLPLSFMAYSIDTYKWWITAGVYCCIGSVWGYIQLQCPPERRQSA